MNEGFARALTGYVNGLKAPDYTTIAWRIARINIKIPSFKEVDDIVIAVDACIWHKGII